MIDVRKYVWKCTRCKATGSVLVASAEARPGDVVRRDHGDHARPGCAGPIVIAPADEPAPRRFRAWCPGCRWSASIETTSVLDARIDAGHEHAIERPDCPLDPAVAELVGHTDGTTVILDASSDLYFQGNGRQTLQFPQITSDFDGYAATRQDGPTGPPGRIEGPDRFEDAERPWMAWRPLDGL